MSGHGRLPLLQLRDGKKNAEVSHPWHDQPRTSNETNSYSSQDHNFSPVALMRLARAMKPMELDSRDEAILQGDVVLQAYFVIKGRIEAYVHEHPASGHGSWAGGDLDGPPLRQASYLGVWGPGSLWGLSNVVLGGLSEVRMVHT